MANIRVTCPTCNAELEIGEEHLGQEVECGSCLGAFKAEDPKSKKKPYKMQRSKDDDRDDDDDDDRPSRRKKRRRRDEEDDYDYSPPGSSSGDGNALAIVSLILGIIAVVTFCCCYLSLPLSVGGIVCGIIGMQKPQGKGMAVAGLVLSILAILIEAGFFMFGFGMNAMNFNNGRFR